MGRWILPLALFLVAFHFTSLVALAEERPTEITIGFVPGDNPESIKENAVEFASLLQTKLGLPVNVFIPKDYVGLVEAMKNKKIDFAFFSALTFVFAEQQSGAKVLLKRVWESSFYYSTILVPFDSKFKSLSDLRQKRFAFVDEKSTSGYLYPQVYFKNNKINAKEYFSKLVFSGHHLGSSELLAKGEVDAIAVYSSDAKAQQNAFVKNLKNIRSQDIKVKKVRSIWISGPIPSDPFCVRPDFYERFPQLSDKTMVSILELQEDKEVGARFKKALGAEQMTWATSQQYDPVREMVKALDIQLK